MKKIPGIIMTSIFAVGLIGSTAVAFAIANNRHFGNNDSADAKKICSNLLEPNDKRQVIECHYQAYITFDDSGNIRDYLSSLEWNEDDSFSAMFEDFEDFDDTVKIVISTFFTSYTMKINKDFSKCAVKSNELLRTTDVKIYNFEQSNGRALAELIIEGAIVK